ncbi:MAG TPA: divalent-cation tolerance protein CutA [Thermoanaerobaculia bacterium]|nr:divalent-cation tolerance protein CutA [Thermoanaerobaculia bacterium]
MNVVLILTTVGVDFDPRPIARDLVESRLAACVNILPAVSSIYQWEGTIHEESEQLLVIKTTAERVDQLQAALFARHPYDVPEFVVIAADRVSDAYGRWLADAVH